MKDSSMLTILETAEKNLPELLDSPENWKGLLIDYHEPFVERVWTHWGAYRLNLHKIYPCESEETLFHPHPWPMATHLLDGNFVMGLGHGEGMESPNKTTTLYATPGLKYEMIHPNAWHSVEPINKPITTFMVSGKPWGREAPKSNYKLQELSGPRKRAIMKEFKKIYSKLI